jgi:hypothetical protein
MKVVLISGKAKNGKDQSATILKELIEQDGKKVLILHYADLLKFICRTYFDWDGKKDDVGRFILQYVGSDIIRKQDPDFWVNFVISFLTMFPTNWNYILIPDCRFPNEITAIPECRTRPARTLWKSYLEMCIRVRALLWAMELFNTHISRCYFTGKLQPHHLPRRH